MKSPPPKFEIQEQQYEFPYHYIPHFRKPDTPSLMRKLSWGLEYLCYQEHLRQKVLALEPSSVLEIGCGDGRFLGSLPGKIPVRIGVDLAPRAIAFAQAFHPECQFMVQPVESVPGKFDVVVVIEVIEHIPDCDLDGFFQALSDKVNTEGVVVLSAPTTNLPLNKKHYRHYTRELLDTQLKRSQAPLEIVDVEYVFKEPWWGRSLRRLQGNRLFTLELDFIMHAAWRSLWNNHRLVSVDKGRHLVAMLRTT